MTTRDETTGARQLTWRSMLALIAISYVGVGAVAVWANRKTQEQRLMKVAVERHEVELREQAAEVAAHRLQQEKERLALEEKLANIAKERIRLEQQLAEATFYQGVILDATINSSSAVVLADDRGIIVWCNHAVLPIYGWQRDELIGRSVNMLVAEPFRKRHETAFPKAKDHIGQLMRVECDGAKKNGETFRTTTRVKSFLRNGRVYSIGMSDPTENVKTIVEPSTLKK